VPVPRFLVDDLAAHVARRESGALLFTAAREARVYPLCTDAEILPIAVGLVSNRPLEIREVWMCSPNGIRTRATALRGRRPGPLDDGAPDTFTSAALGYQDSNLD
jgi:hypothetical protein